MSTSEPQPSQPEFLGADAAADDPRPTRRRNARTGVIVAASVAAVTAVGAAAYGVGQLMSGGGAPASAVPADAVVYASLDLDPSAAQKVEAFTILRKFPALRSELAIESRDDLRRTIVEEVIANGDCSDVSYADDVEPWIGQRVAVALRPAAGGEVVPLVALQVTDEDAARRGVRALERCDSGSESSGLAFTGDYLLLSDTTSHARKAAADAESAALEDDEDYTTWMARVGEPGIMSMYASADAPRLLAAAGASGDGEGDAGQSGTSGERADAAFGDFEGAAGVVRFADGAVEVATATRGLGDGVGASASTVDVRTLPAGTAAALSVAFEDGWLSRYLDRFAAATGDTSAEDLMREVEQETGLELPEDIETLLGKSLDVSVDARADLATLAGSADPSQVPAGIRIKGDVAAIRAVIDKLTALAEPDADVLEVRSGDGVVAVGTNADYVASLLDQGALGEDEAFARALPDAEQANGVLFLSFDAGDGWTERLADLLSDGDPEVRRHVAPLDALGISSRVDDDGIEHGLARLTTD